jgi:hypothetical protein
MKKEYNNQINSNLMKKVLLLCFISIVALFNSWTYAQEQDCCFWVVNGTENTVLDYEEYSLTAPAWQETHYYYFHFRNDCNLPRDTKWSIGWEIRRNGVLLDDSTDLAKLSQYAEVAFQINTVEYGWIGAAGDEWVGENVRSGVGNQYAAQYLNNPLYADFPGAIAYQGDPAAGYIDLPNFQTYNFFYLHFLEHVSQTNGMRMKITWNGPYFYGGDYEIKFTLYQRTGGTTIEHYYIPTQQQDYFGGHQSGVSGIIAEFTLDPMDRGRVEDEICAGEIYSFGVQPNGTPYTYFDNTATWPNSVTSEYIVPTYIQPEPCYGPAVERVDTLILTVHPLPPAPVVADVERCGAGEVTFTVTNVEDNVTYIWYADAAMTEELARGTTYTVNLANDDNVVTVYTYYILAQSEHCDSELITITATSNPIPELNLDFTQITCPYNHTMDVVVTVTDGSYVGDLTYEWIGAAGNGATGVVTITDECDVMYYFTVTVTDEKGCTNSDTDFIVAQDIVPPTVNTDAVEVVTITGCTEDALPAALDVAGLIEAGFVFTDDCTDPANGTNFTAQADSVVRGGTDCNIILKRYYVVKDYCGNASAPFYHQFNVTDNEAPTFTAPTQPYNAQRDTGCTFVITQAILDQILTDLAINDNCTPVADIQVEVSVTAGTLITEPTQVTFTLTDLCDNESTATAMVNIPYPTVTINAVPESLEICSGDPIAFNLTFENAFPPYNIVWSDAALEGTEVTVTPVSANQYVDETFVYTVTVTDSLGCEFDDQVTVTVWGNPEFTLTENHAICLGETATLVATLILPPPTDTPVDMAMPNANEGPFTYLWSTGETTPTIQVTPDEVGTYTYSVTVTNEHGCTTEKSVTVTVNPVPVATMNIVGEFEADSCLYNDLTVTITVTSDIPATAEFVILITKDEEEPDTVTNVNGVGTYTFEAAGTYVVTAYTYDSETGCQSDPVTETFVFYPVPELELEAEPTAICIGDSFVLTATTTPNLDTYTYYFNGEELGTTINNLTITPETVGLHTYTVIVVTIDGCVIYDTLDVMVNPLPQVEYITAESECPHVEYNAPVAVMTVGTAPFTFVWSGQDIEFDGSGNPYFANIDRNGANHVTVHVTDANGCQNTFSDIVYFVDTIKPTIELAGQDLEYSVTCDFITSPSIEEVVLTDNCTPSGEIILFFWEETEPGVCPNTYDLIRKWRAKDKCGNYSDTLVQVIHIVDVTPPVITAVPADYEVACEELQPYNVNDPGLVVTDNCSEVADLTVTVTETVIPYTVVGTYYIHRDWYVTDECDNVSDPMRQTITVTDDEVPTLSSDAPANMILNCDDEIPVAVELTFTDNCTDDIVILLQEVSTQTGTPADSTYYNYTITRTWIAVDFAGNQSTPVVQTITVQDVNAPVIDPETPATITANCDDTAPAELVVFNDNCQDVIVPTYTDDSTQGDDPLLANYYNYTITRTWNAKDVSGNAAIPFVQTVNVVDVTDPVAIVDEDTPQDLTLSCEENLPLADATMVDFEDNCSPVTVTYNEVVNAFNPEIIGQYTITRTWTGTDVSGNAGEYIVTLTILDSVAPVVVESTIPAPITVECNALPDTAVVEFTDNCTASLDIVINVYDVSTQDADPTVEAHYNYTITRSWIATDALGNNSDPVVQVITVQDVTAPVFATVPAAITIYTDADCEYDANPTITGLATATDNCDPNPTVTHEDVAVAGEVPGAWTITRTWTATDVMGNSVTATQIITVEDNTAPTFTVPADITICKHVDGTYADLITPDLTGEPTNIEDNCSTVFTVTYTDDESTAGTATTDGHITRTWRVTDEAGNYTELDQIITTNHTPVVEIVGSEGICYNETVPQQLTATGADTYVWSTGETDATIGILVAGTYTVTGTLANGCSNTATIVVTDYEIPTITSTVNDQICIGDQITLVAQAIYEDGTLVDGDWTVIMISGTDIVTTAHTGQVGEFTYTSAPVFVDTYFEVVFTDIHGCTYDVHTTATTIVNDDPRLRLYTDTTQAPNNVLDIETGEVAEFFIKIEVCGDYDRRAQIQFQVYKDGQIVNDFLPYLADNEYSVSYYIAQNGILHPNENNTYYNRIATGTIPFANTAQYAPFNGFFVSYSTNAYDWFYMHFFNERFIKVKIDALIQPGEYTIVYDLVGADASCALTDNSTNYVAGMSYGGSGFSFCNNTIDMATNTMYINVTGDPIINGQDPQPAPIAPNTQSNVNVYPNPASEEAITLQFENMSGNAVISIVTLNGKVLHEFDTKISETKNSYTLPQMKLNPGIYFIKVTNDKAVLTKKLIVQ